MATTPSLAAWEGTRQFLHTQPGYLATRLHRSLSPEVDFRFVNLGRYTSPQAFQAATGQPGFRQAAAAIRAPRLPRPVRGPPTLSPPTELRSRPARGGSRGGRRARPGVRPTGEVEGDSRHRDALAVMADIQRLAELERRRQRGHPARTRAPRARDQQVKTTSRWWSGRPSSPGPARPWDPGPPDVLAAPKRPASRPHDGPDREVLERAAHPPAAPTVSPRHCGPRSTAGWPACSPSGE